MAKGYTLYYKRCIATSHLEICLVWCFFAVRQTTPGGGSANIFYGRRVPTRVPTICFAHFFYVEHEKRRASGVAHSNCQGSLLLDEFGKCEETTDFPISC